MGEIPFLEWLVNFIFCVSTLLTIAVVTKVLEQRRIWTPTMSLACFARLLLMRYQMPALMLIPLVLFGVGIYDALSTRPWEENFKLAASGLGSLLWFGFIFWKVISLIFYFCAGCIF